MAETFDPELIYGNGDGTVHHASLAVCDRWTESINRHPTDGSALADTADFLSMIQGAATGWESGIMESAIQHNVVSAHTYAAVTHVGMLTNADAVIDSTGYLGEVIFARNTSRLVEVLYTLAESKAYY